MRWQCVLEVMNRFLTSFCLLVLTCMLSTVTFLDTSFNQQQFAEARTEHIVDNTNNNLEISMVAPDNWNSGVVSETISNLNWRLNGLNALNNDANAVFAVANLPSLVNTLLPFGQKTGIVSLILSQYVTINKEYDITLSDGSPGHLYSISATPEQLQKANLPIKDALDAVLITTQQGGITYVVAYGTHLGKMAEFEGVFQNMLNSVRFGAVGFSSVTKSEVPSASEVAPSSEIVPRKS